MDNIIYSVSLLRTFLSPFGSILFTGLLGATAFAAAIFQKNKGGAHGSQWQSAASFSLFSAFPQPRSRLHPSPQAHRRLQCA